MRGHSACRTRNRGRKMYARRGGTTSTGLGCSSYLRLEVDKRGIASAWVRSESRSKERISRERGIVQWKVRS